VRDGPDSAELYKAIFAEMEAIAAPESQFPEIVQAIKTDCGAATAWCLE